MVLMPMVPFAGLLAVAFALYLAWNVLRRDTGTDAMRAVGALIVEGANAFLSRQYKTIAWMAIVTAVVLGVVVGYFAHSQEEGLLTSVAFLLGAACSSISGYIGMYIAVRANLRTASAAQRSLKEAITVALNGGAVSGFLVTAMSLLGVAGIFYIYSGLLGHPIEKTPFLIVGYGFGASFVALFAQLGGGIYTKAADVGADLVGKVEAGIPEDDPRNAAVIADLVGDNVGDCAGRGADLFESMAAENIGAMIIGTVIAAALTAKDGQPHTEWIFFPLVLRSFGIFATIVGLLSVPLFARPGKDAMSALNGGYYVVSILSVAGLYIVTNAMMGASWTWFFASGLVGIAVGIVFVYITQYYTAGSWRPVQEIARASLTGPATTVITGTAVGFETTAATAITIGVALVGSYTLGAASGLPEGGIYGTAVATMAMLMSAAYVLAMDTFGPITDNAGGITEFAHASSQAREITDQLDAVGNTTKALTKGYAVASAGLAAFLLFSAYLDRVKELLGPARILAIWGQTETSVSPAVAAELLARPLPVNLSHVETFVGAMLGAMLVYLFSSLAIRAVGSAAAEIIEEVRRQFREDPGIMAGTSKPDYHRAVDITARAALRQMVAPGLLAVFMPVVVGVIFRLTGGQSGNAGWESVAGLVMVGTIAGVLLATFLNNSGGAWDNAKKFIEAGGLKDASGQVQGKGSLAHAAGVVGDTIGDPYKDTAGPSLHVLVKLLSTITLVLAPLFVS